MAIDSTFLDQLKKMNFLARKKVSNLYVGGRKSILQGKGIEVVDYREYYPGDDFRSIDWKLYGRTEKLYIKRFEEEKNLTLHLLVDSSASMDFSLDGMKKFDYASSLAAGFAYVAMHKYEKFTTTLYSNEIMNPMPINKSKRHFFQTIELFNNASLAGETNLKKCMGQYGAMIKSKSFLVVLSDFLEPIDTLREGIYRIAKNSKEAILIQVLDPGEINLHWSDDVRFEDMESPESMRTYLSPGFKRDYSTRIQSHIFNIQEICNETGLDFFSLQTNNPLFDSFVQVVEGGRRAT